MLDIMPDSFSCPIRLNPQKNFADDKTESLLKKPGDFSSDTFFKNGRIELQLKPILSSMTQCFNTLS